MRGFNFKDKLKSFYNLIIYDIYKYLKEMIKKQKDETNQIESLLKIFIEKDNICI